MEEAPPGKPCLVIVVGSSTGRWYPIDPGVMTIGRSSSCTIVIAESAVSREHARLMCEGEQTVLEDLKSRNGTTVNRERIERWELRSGDLIQVGRTVLKYLCGSDIETQYHEEIYRLATVDPLTGVHNRRAFNEVLERELSRARRHKTCMALALIDVDNFKRVNDTHGHPVGDDVLRELAWRVRSSLRREDFLARYGGEEFVLVLPDTDAVGARSVSEKVRQLVADVPIVVGKISLAITVSVGFIAVLGGPEHTAAGLLAAVDAKLYEAKAGGRNLVFG
ncbi:MAG: GGDEF domain-containing protein [Deltaproteobacteria bacterium]|nr:GGDEF domain-containing protein [Deltaproteobacteria bacterium]